MPPTPEAEKTQSGLPMVVLGRRAWIYQSYETTGWRIADPHDTDFHLFKAHCWGNSAAMAKPDEWPSLAEAEAFVRSLAARESLRRSFAYGNAAMANPYVTREVVDRVADEMANEAAARQEIETLRDNLITLQAEHDEAIRELEADVRELREENERLKTNGNPLLSKVVDDFMRDALVAIAGAVCTPEKGYLEDGGLRQLLADIKTLRKQHNDFKLTYEIRNAHELFPQPGCDCPVCRVHRRLKDAEAKLTAAEQRAAAAEAKVER